MMRKNYSTSRGQIMLLTTMVLSGTLLAAIMIAGVLMIYQIRQAGNGTESAKAVFASDAGIEYQLFKFFKDDCATAPTLSNGASIDSQITVDSASRTVITSRGSAGNTYRGFTLILGKIDSPVPPCGS